MIEPDTKTTGIVRCCSCGTEVQCESLANGEGERSWRFPRGWCFGDGRFRCPQCGPWSKDNGFAEEAT